MKCEQPGPKHTCKTWSIIRLPATPTSSQGRWADDAVVVYSAPRQLFPAPHVDVTYALTFAIAFDEDAQVLCFITRDESQNTRHIHSRVQCPASRWSTGTLKISGREDSEALAVCSASTFRASSLDGLCTCHATSTRSVLCSLCALTRSKAHCKRTHLCLYRANI